jgi:hypothetical protein
LTTERPVVVAVRHPDYETEFSAFAGVGEPIILEVDLGRSFDGTCDDAEQYADWSASLLRELEDAGLRADHPAREPFSEAVRGAAPE